MKRLGAIFALVALGFVTYVTFAPVAATQPTGWLSLVHQDSQAIVQFRVMGAYGAPGFIGHGTAYPTIANSGQGPMNGEHFIVRDNASANEPVVGVYSLANTAWRTSALSTLATNAVDIVNSVWLGTNQVIFEGNVADAGEGILTWANSATDATFTFPADNATWAGAGTVMVSVAALNAPDVANGVWGVANSLHFEGATPDDWELALQAMDATTADQNFFLPNTNVGDNYNLMFSVLDTNSLQIANSIWFDSNIMVFEGPSLDTEEMTFSAADATADLIHSLVDHNYGAAGYFATELDYDVLSTPVIHSASGYFSIPPLFTHSEDVVHDSTTGNDGMYVYRMYLPHPLDVSDASVLLVDGAALAVGDICGIAIYEDDDDGLQLTEGTGDGTAAGLETVALADVSLEPGFYRFAICSSDATNMHFAGTLFDDEQIDLVAGIAGDILYGLGTNPCVTGDPPATTGALITDDEAIPFIVFH